MRQREICECHLSHNFQGPAVPHADGLRRVGGDLAVLLSGPQQGRPEHGCQVVERHLVDAFFLCHPEDRKTAKSIDDEFREQDHMQVILMCSNGSVCQVCEYQGPNVLSPAEKNFWDTRTVVLP